MGRKFISLTRTNQTKSVAVNVDKFGDILTWILLFFLIGIALSLRSTAFAAMSLVPGVSLEPIVGYERVYKTYPDFHYHEHMIYGARVVAGISALSAEAEYTRGSDSESFLAPSVTVADSAEKIKLGARTSYGLGSLLSTHLRAGGQATQNTHSVTAGGVTTSTKDKIKYSPYAGWGLKIGLGTNLSLAIDGVAVINELNDFKRNDYQVTAGVALHLP